MRCLPLPPGVDDLDPRYLEPDESPRLISLSDSHDEPAALLDYEDWLWARRWLWYPKPSRAGKNTRPKLYACRNTRLSHNGPQICVWLHREICVRAHGKSRGSRIVPDHINGNSLDNRRENLRWATIRENRLNRVPHLTTRTTCSSA